MAMEKLKEVFEYEIVALCRHKLARTERRKFTLRLGPRMIPPFIPYREVEILDEVVGVRYIIYTRPNPENGGWLLHVRVKEESFNPVLKESPVLSSK
jgi:hypothetical protein